MSRKHVEAPGNLEPVLLKFVARYRRLQRRPDEHVDVVAIEEHRLNGTARELEHGGAEPAPTTVIGTHPRQDLYRSFVPPAAVGKFAAQRMTAYRELPGPGRTSKPVRFSPTHP